jgi:hypothetical protein
MISRSGRVRPLAGRWTSRTVDHGAERKGGRPVVAQPPTCTTGRLLTSGSA